MGEPAIAANKRSGFLHSAVWLAACVTGTAVLLLPIAWTKSGTGSPWGLAFAAAVCFVASLASELCALILTGSGSALASLAIGMGARMLPPLAVCLFLAAAGQNGREHLAFVCYLIAFYLVTLTVDTMLAVRRLAAPSSWRNSSLL